MLHYFSRRPLCFLPASRSQAVAGAGGAAGCTGDSLTLQHFNLQEISRERWERFLSAFAGERGRGNLIGGSWGERRPRNHCKNADEVEIGRPTRCRQPGGTPWRGQAGARRWTEGHSSEGRTHAAGTTAAWGRDLSVRPPAAFPAPLPQPRGPCLPRATPASPGGCQAGSRPAVTPNQKDNAGLFLPALMVTGCRASGAVIYHASP